MSKEIQIFANDQFGEVRTLTKDGEPWFVGKDVADILGYSDTAQAVRKHIDNEDKGVVEMTTPGGKQPVTIINESGLYSLILSSKLPTARAFKRWVTSEVLPAIRKHGEYTAPKVSQKRLGEVNSAARIIRQTLKEAGMAPQFVAVAMKSLYAPVGVEIPLEGVTLNKQLFDATAIAKQLGVKEKPFIAFLLEKKYIYRDQKGKIMPYADKNNGLFEVKECFNEKTKWSGTQTLVTPKGRETFRLLCQGLAN